MSIVHIFVQIQAFLIFCNFLKDMEVFLIIVQP